MRELSALSIIENAENTFTEVVFSTHTLHARCARLLIASRAHAPKVPRTDSESGFLAMKKFSCLTSSGLANAHQRGSLLRITSIDSQQRIA
jgi:hypothetical protein